jgi:hypothetical protein
VNVAPAGEAFAHLTRIGSIALGPAAVAVLTEIYQYLGKARAARDSSQQ